MKNLTDLARKQLATISLLLFLIGIGALIIALKPAKATPQEYYKTIPQCQSLTKSQCIALLEQQVTTAKLNLKWEQR